LFSITGRILSVKFDCSTKHNRPTLGINIQFIKNAKIQIRNIAMTEMIDRSTGDNLKAVILEKFKQFDILTGNIYSFSIDNGANVVKTVKLLRNETSTEEETDCDDYLSDDESDEDEDSSSETEDDSDELNNSTFLENEAWVDAVENVVIKAFGESENTDDFCVTIRCAAHSIQLSVMDTIKTKRIAGILKKCRRVVKKLRTSTMRLQLQKEDEKKPIIDSKIRWNSQYNMMFRLMELKSFCQKYENVTPELRLTDHVWEEIEALLEALKPIKILTRQVQSVQMTLSDFYGHYVKCRLLLSKSSNEYAQLLAKSMNGRESLFTNNILLTAVYLDPRYQVLLSPEDKINAQKHLSFLYKKIHRNEDESQSNVSQSETVTQDSQEELNSRDHEMEFESFLDEMESRTNVRSQTPIQTNSK
jgi:hypothetical protein